MIETRISISGHPITYIIQEKDIDEIEFYQNNPRIATIVDGMEIVTEKAIDDALWQLSKTHELKRTIEQDGGLIHPIIVYKNKVLEGNTRLCCYRHLFNEFNDKKWRKIPCQIITEPLPQDDIYRLLCTEHIGGKIEWDAWEKAHFFCKLQEEEGKSSEEIAKIAKESVSSINNKIKAYKLMIQSGVRDKNKYSYFEQIVVSKPIRDISKTEPEIETKIIKKVKDGTIKKAETIRKVGEVWKHKDARKEAFADNRILEDVYHELKANAPMTDSPLMKDTEDLLTRVKALTREEREAIKKNSRDRSKIEFLTKELVRLCNEMDIKVHIPKKIAG
jgi:hypothetical protein